MASRRKIIGIDAGSITVSLVELDNKGNVIRAGYKAHNGDIEQTVRQLLEKVDWSEIGGIAVTDSTPDIINQVFRVDTRVSVIAATRRLRKEAGSILTVGGETFGLISFDENGGYRSYRSNSSCAAGTGSFLDQQAKRLNLDNIEAFTDIAYRNKSPIPKIASRCAVFAKTDLIHAQQEGFGLEAICDGLSRGLAESIVDTLFIGWEPSLPLIMVGGVAGNRAVVRHLSELLGVLIDTPPEAPVFSAIGCALSLMDELKRQPDSYQFSVRSASDLFKKKRENKQFTYPPLELKLTEYPEFNSVQRYEHKSIYAPEIPPVETDIYKDLTDQKVLPVHLGFDIGSTSTKAVLIDSEGNVLAGFYTRTSGRPIEATRAILETIADIQKEHQLTFDFLTAGTTGSGRKFVGEIIGADLALDEITAHARAAVELNPDVDTIIEIGGQDSKFTTLKDGRVTFSIMNNVCAAGTGSFIEEQAKKLGCPLEEYSARTMSVTAPMTSDKCTVFMERDLNYYLREGYSVNESLTSVLHAVRENYLTKVASEKNIGKTIFFQGATAKNPSLVAAFEQKLKRPILVSKFCHLTGALGVALYLKDKAPERSCFKGLSLYKEQIPVNTEICELCANHCKIKTAIVNDETVAFGFLCGRDYEDERFVKEKHAGLNLLTNRTKALSTTGDSTREYHQPVVGIPAALHLYDEIDLWCRFFDILGVKTITSEKYKTAVKDGKKIMGAEFCAPVAALHGHVQYLAERADYIFLPDFLEVENSSSKARRQYCYYTQYMPSLISEIPAIKKMASVLNPTLRTIRGALADKYKLYRAIGSIIPEGISFFKISAAYDKASTEYHKSLSQLRSDTMEAVERRDDIVTVLLGRPYTILSSEMNGQIPDLIAKQGVATVFQDMLAFDRDGSKELVPLMDSLHWRYASEILRAADIIAGKKGMYPVLITSFKCTPDAYVIDLFKRIMESRKKPYLILQLDDHDSSVGYETRIEAGIRSFKNHYETEERGAFKNPSYERAPYYRDSSTLKGKTLLLPGYDRMPIRLIEAALRNEGVDARMVNETTDSVRRGNSLNTGQCLPASWITQAAIDYIEENDLDPAQTALWSIDSNISCNLGVFNDLLKNALEFYGRGMEKVQIYAGEITYLDISFRMTRKAFFAYMFGGILKKIGCRYRPYEEVPGETNRAIARAMDIFYDMFLNDTSKEAAVKEALAFFEPIRVKNWGSRPKVAIFGDLYARDNEVVNQGLIDTIERNGGETITTPYNEYLRIIANPFIKKWLREGLYYNAATAQLLLKTFPLLEKKYYRLFNRILKESEHTYLSDPEKILKKFNIKMLQTGESLETILKIFTLLNNYSDIALFVQTSPSLCCPSLITEAMAHEIESETGIPVVTIEYDGTGGQKNSDIIPYLKYPRERTVEARRMA